MDDWFQAMEMPLRQQQLAAFESEALHHHQVCVLTVVYFFQLSNHWFRHWKEKNWRVIDRQRQNRQFEQSYNFKTQCQSSWLLYIIDTCVCPYMCIYNSFREEMKIVYPDNRHENDHSNPDKRARDEHIFVEEFSRKEEMDERLDREKSWFILSHPNLWAISWIWYCHHFIKRYIFLIYQWIGDLYIVSIYISWYIYNDAVLGVVDVLMFTNEVLGAIERRGDPFLGSTLTLWFDLPSRQRQVVIFINILEADFQLITNRCKARCCSLLS